MHWFSARVSEMYKRKDYYHERAKKEGYRSRAAYKLKEINKRFRLIRKGDYVLDLGCSPGGWMQVAREIVGERGYVLGVDKVRALPLQYNNVDIIENDLEEFHTEMKFNVVLSDISPKIMGKRDVDQYRSYILAKKALEVAEKVLEDRGNFMVKIFQSEDVKSFSDDLRKRFGYVKFYRPRSTRKGSSEIYIICKSFKTSCL